MSIDTIIVSAITMLGTTALVYFVLKKNQAGTAVKHPLSASKVSPEIVSQAENVIEAAKTKAKQIELDAKNDALKIKEDAEKESQTIRSKALDVENKAEQRLNELYSKSKEIADQEVELKTLKSRWHNKNKEVEKLRQKQTEKLQSISSLTKEEAKDLILNNLEKSLEERIAKKIKEAEEAISMNIDQKAKELLLDAMHTASTDYVAEYTITTVKLESEDIKGRIIGKEGRNIRAFEDATGVNVDFDDENEVRLSSFDSVRREIARLSLQDLIKDGRIHPGRIEEIVDKNTRDIQKVIIKAGEDLCQQVGVYNLPKEIVEKLGHFKYRTSYGQNMIQHTLEETRIGVKIANEIGANIPVTKLACLLHDIGKVITEKDGNHVELGAEFLKKYNLPAAVITAVAEHHNDKPSTAEGVIVQIADSISGSRPGARYEDYENFVKRMTDLEQAAQSFEGVEKAYAISAGREVRVVVQPDEVNDIQAIKLSSDIAKKIEEEQTFPGTVKVVVIRELRSVSTAS